MATNEQVSMGINLFLSVNYNDTHINKSWFIVNETRVSFRRELFKRSEMFLFLLSNSTLLE